MNWPLERWPRLRREAHFGRVFKCFAERPAQLNAMFAYTVSRHAGDEALVCGDARVRRHVRALDLAALSDDNRSHP